MAVPDAPDWQLTINVTAVATQDNPDWQVTAVGPGGTPIGGGYASLTGPGQTTTPGDLTQAGGFDVNDNVGDGIALFTVGAASIFAEDSIQMIVHNSGFQCWVTGAGSNGIALSDGLTYTPPGPGIYLVEQNVATITLQTNGPILLQSAEALTLTPSKLTITLTSVPVYADNAAAITGGLTAGDVYRTGADPDPLCIVH